MESETSIPTDLQQALEEKEVLKLFNRRPDFQRRDWPAWVEAAAGPADRRRRIETIVRELMQGDYTPHL